MYEEDVTAHVVFTHDVVAATEDDEPHVLRQHLDKRLVRVVKQRHLVDETNSDIWRTKQAHSVHVKPHLEMEFSIHSNVKFITCIIFILSIHQPPNKNIPSTKPKDFNHMSLSNIILTQGQISAIYPSFREMLNLHSWAMVIEAYLKINNIYNILMLMIFPPSLARKKVQVLNLVAT